MKRKDDALDKTLHQHLGLFGASAAQLAASRERIRERLRQREPGLLSKPAPGPADVRPLSSPRLGQQYGWRLGVSLAAAAVLIAFVTTGRWDRADAVATLDGAGIAEGTVVRSDDRDGAMLVLADGSRVEMHSPSALSVEREADGLGIRLRTGGIIVDAVKQRGGHLYVHTRDVTVTVVGTVFLVNAEDDGSRVGVIEGEVRVREGDTETRLRPGEQVSTSLTLASRPLTEAITWSRNANAHLSVLASFTRGMAETSGALMPLAPVSAAAAAARAGQGASAAAGRPEFEAASVKPCDPDNLPPAPEGARGGGANSLQMTPARTYALCMTLATLIRTAYGYGPVDLEFLQADGRGRGMRFDTVYGLGVEDGRRVRGGPDWVRSERYTIEAVAGAPVDPEIMRGAMLRALLEHRFQLKAHIETEPVAALALTIARSGLKIKPVDADACMPLVPGTAVRSDGFVQTPPGVLQTTRPRSFADVRRGERPSCGLFGQRNGPNSVLVAGGVAFEGLARILGSALGRIRVFDKTGLTDRFNFVLEYLPDPTAADPLASPFAAAPDPPGVAPAQPLHIALEEDLGLRLDPDRAVREFIVVDAVERPAAN